MLRRTRGFALTTLLATALLVASMGPLPAAEATGDGTLTVQVVDQYGNPRLSTVQAVSSGGQRTILGSPDGDTFPAPAVAHTAALPPGAYALAIVTDWGGLVCAGFMSCAPSDFGEFFLNRTPPFAVGVTVVADQTVSHTATVTIPSIEGTGTVGSTLSVVPSPGVAALDTWSLPSAYPQSVSWTRGGNGGFGRGPQHTVTRLDNGKAVAARIHHSGAASNFLRRYGFSPNMATAPFTTNAIQIAPVPPTPTTTTMRTRTRSVGGARIPIRGRVTAAGTAEVHGRVRVTVGSWSRDAVLRNGNYSVTTPRLEVGKVKVTAVYLGRKKLLSSSAPPRTIKVAKPRGADPQRQAGASGSGAGTPTVGMPKPTPT